MKQDERLTSLEMTLSYQERMVEELNTIVIAQQVKIDALELMVKHLSTKMRDVGTSDILFSAEEPPPPHY